MFMHVFVFLCMRACVRVLMVVRFLCEWYVCTGEGERVCKCESAFTYCYAERKIRETT